MSAAGRCPQGEARSGKHKWVFVKNISTARISHGPHGSHGVFSLRGLYKCDCGADRVGQCKHDAPGADLREHLSGVAL